MWIVYASGVAGLVDTVDPTELIQDQSNVPEFGSGVPVIGGAIPNTVIGTVTGTGAILVPDVTGDSFADVVVGLNGAFYVY